jgi:HK97 family phage major capsid protein
MPSYNNLVSRTSAQALIPEVVSREILKGLTNESALLSIPAVTRVPMSTNQTRMPVLAALPTAYFVSGDTGLKQTTQVDWTNKFLNVEEIAAIVPIPEAVLDDVAFNVWDSIMPLLQNAIARTLDAAAIFGTNKPASWPNALVTDAITAGNAVLLGANAAAAGGIVGDFSDTFGKVEADGYDPNGAIAATTFKGRLRQARATTGESLIEPDDGQVTSTSIYGVPIFYPMRGLWPAPFGAGATLVNGTSQAIVGDFSQVILGIRQDITMKVLDQAVIQDGSGVIQYNLAQQDLVALRIVFRCAFQVANTINYDQATAANRYPVAVLLG